MVRTYLLNGFFSFFPQGGNTRLREAHWQRNKKGKKSELTYGLGSDKSEEDSAQLEHGLSPIAPSRHFDQTQGDLF